MTPILRRVEKLDSGTIIEAETTTPMSKVYSSSYHSWVNIIAGKTTTTVTIRLPVSKIDVEVEILSIIDNHKADYYEVYTDDWELRCPGYVVDNTHGLVVKQEIKRMIESRKRHPHTTIIESAK